MPLVDTVKAGDTGAGVGALQQALIERGAWPRGAQDELGGAVFGETTTACVRTFQAKVGLVVDGVCGSETWRALNDFSGFDSGQGQNFPPLPIGARVGVLRSTAIVLADQAFRSGVRENPMGSNRGQLVDKYLIGLDGGGASFLKFRPDAQFPGGWVGAPWCGRFAKYMIDDAASQVGQQSPLAGWGDLASAAKWQLQARSREKLLVVPTDACVGLILVSGGHGHVVLVANALEDTVVCIEGNSGNRVAKRQRMISQFAGFVAIE